MKLVLIAVLAILQAAPPVPRQAIKDHTDKSGTETQIPKNRQETTTPLAPSITVSTRVNADGTTQSSKNKADNDERRTPKYEHWSRADKLSLAYDVLTGLLVIIGGLGVCFALRTLTAIQGQVDEMKAQRGVMEGQLTAMQGQLAQMVASGAQTDRLIDQATIQAEKAGSAANAAIDNARAAIATAEVGKQNIELLINKERARLRIDMKPLNLTKKFGAVYTVDFTVSIYGSTAAYIRETGCVTYALPQNSIDCEEPGSAIIFPISRLPNVIAPNGPAIEQYAFLYLSHEDVLLPEIKAGRHLVGVRGFIKYRDVFDRDRETRFRYVWKSSFFGVQDITFGNWEKCGSTEDNQNS